MKDNGHPALQALPEEYFGKKWMDKFIQTHESIITLKQPGMYEKWLVFFKKEIRKKEEEIKNNLQLH